MTRRQADYYDVLGLSRDATTDQIKRAFRELARRFHPDVNPIGVDRFKEIGEAYETLIHPVRRSDYDRLRSKRRTAREAVSTAIADVFGKKRVVVAQDLRFTLEITLKEAAFGCVKQIGVPVDPSSSTSPNREFTVAIPPGVRDGSVRTIKGEGMLASDDKTRGDLHIYVRIADDAVLRREGDDIWSDIPLDPVRLMIGGTVEVHTLDGMVRMKLPAGSESGRLFRLRGHGIAKTVGATPVRGDHYVRVVASAPSSLSRDEIAALGRYLELTESRTPATTATSRRKR